MLPLDYLFFSCIYFLLLLAGREMCKIIPVTKIRKGVFSIIIKTENFDK
jgi:hypothetical protein